MPISNETRPLLDAISHTCCEPSPKVVADIQIQHANGMPKPKTSAFFDAHTFATVVASAPLVAIDLIVEDVQGAVLLGLRKNPPAKGYWFVPGGRIRKDETLNNAFARIAQDELRLHAQMTQSRCIGIYEHFYDTNFNGTVGATTHYLVLAYCLKMARESLQLPHEQHSQYIWMQPDQIAQHPDVHPYTQAYFLN